MCMYIVCIYMCICTWVGVCMYVHSVYMHVGVCVCVFT